MKNSGKALAAMLFLLIGIPAHAACTVTTTGVSFGAYDVFTAVPRDTTGTVTVSCTNNQRVPIVVSIGASPTSGGFNPRQMLHARLSEAESSSLDAIRGGRYPPPPRTLSPGNALLTI